MESSLGVWILQKVVNYRVSYGTSEIEFSLDRRDRKTMAIHVYPDEHVEVVAPIEASEEKILQKVRKRSKWIYSKQLEFRRIQPRSPKPTYRSGETFRYLGKQYRLKIVVGEPAVMLKNGRFLLSSPEGYSSEKKEALFLDWYRQKGRIAFGERLQECLKFTAVIGVDESPDWTIKVMPKRWGSCTKEGKLYLNPELIAAPKPCIDYVILHELCHLREHNHGPRFYSLLQKVYPDWKKWRDYLNENIEVRLV